MNGAFIFERAGIDDQPSGDERSQEPIDVHSRDVLRWSKITSNTEILPNWVPVYNNFADFYTLMCLNDL